MQLHKLTCSYISLHAVTWACMQLHELSCSSLSLHAVTFIVWAAHKNFAVLVELNLHNETTTTLFVERWDVFKFSCHWKRSSWPNPAKDKQKGLLKPLHCSVTEWTLLAPIKIIFHWLTFTLCKKLIIWARFYKRNDTVDFKSENPAQFIDWIQHEINLQWV